MPNLTLQHCLTLTIFMRLSTLDYRQVTKHKPCLKPKELKCSFLYTLDTSGVRE